MKKIERLLLAVHSVFNSLMERKKDFDAAAVRDMFQGNADMQMTLLKLLDRHNEEMKARVGVDRAPTTMSTYVYTGAPLPNSSKRNSRSQTLSSDRQLNEQFIRDYQDFCLERKRLAMETVRHYLSILKKICRIAYKEGHSEKYHSATSSCPSRRKVRRKYSAVRISRSCVIWRYRKNAGHMSSPRTSSFSPVTPAPPMPMR